MSEWIPAPLRRLVSERADGRCEYCLIHEDDAALSHSIDHIVARKHGGQTIAENLAYACAVCNSFKGSDIATLNGDTGGLARLFNPRTDDWNEHFRFESGRILPLSSEGRATAYLLQFNRSDVVQLRQLLARLGRYPGRVV